MMSSMLASEQLASSTTSTVVPSSRATSQQPKQSQPFGVRARQLSMHSSLGTQLGQFGPPTNAGSTKHPVA